MNDICKKCTEFKDKNCKGMEKFYSGCIYFKGVSPASAQPAKQEKNTLGGLL